MKVSVDQYCINVSNLETSVAFYEKTLCLTITHRVEEKEFREVILSGESGNRTQLAWQRERSGPIEHGNGFWKLYLQTDDCAGLYKRCIDAGAESVMEPKELEEWPVVAAFVKDPDGYLVELLETRGEAAAISGSESH
jgi:lactoylglutathione lyase